MPMFDFRCEDGHTFEALVRTAETVPPCRECGKTCTKVWVQGSGNSVIGDEIDVTIQHGLCNPDGSPRRFRSRQELQRAEQKAGYTNYVVHQGTKGGDKSKHTSRWV